MSVMKSTTGAPLSFDHLSCLAPSDRAARGTALLALTAALLAVCLVGCGGRSMPRTVSVQVAVFELTDSGWEPRGVVTATQDGDALVLPVPIPDSNAHRRAAAWPHWIGKVGTSTLYAGEEPGHGDHSVQRFPMDPIAVERLSVPFREAAPEVSIRELEEAPDVSVSRRESAPPPVMAQAPMARIHVMSIWEVLGDGSLRNTGQTAEWSEADRTFDVDPALFSPSRGHERDPSRPHWIAISDEGPQSWHAKEDASHRPTTFIMVSMAGQAVDLHVREYVSVNGEPVPQDVGVTVPYTIGTGVLQVNPSDFTASSNHWTGSGTHWDAVSANGLVTLEPGSAATEVGDGTHRPQRFHMDP